MGATKKKGKKRLTQKQLNFLKAKLLEKRRELLARLRADADPDNLGETDPGDDLLDRALDSSERETSYKIVEIESSAVEQIDDAIARIESGSYGVCEVCGEAIPPARLKAMPSATMCIQCKSEEEQYARPGQDLSGRYRFEDTYDESFDPERIYGTVRGRKVS